MIIIVMICHPFKIVIHSENMRCEYSTFAPKVIFVEGFWAKAWFCFEFSGWGPIYRLYEIALQKMGNGTIREMNPELEKDLLPDSGVVAINIYNLS